MIWCLCVWTVCGLLEPSWAEEPTLAEIVEAVRQNELLYERIDFTLRGKYRTFNRQPPPPPADQGPFQSREVLAEDWTLRVVYQPPYYRIERPTRHVYSETESKEMPAICAYDGEKTRFLMDQIGNVSVGFRIHTFFPTPHTLLMFEWMKAPLSAYLAGDDALKRLPKGRRLPNDYSVQVTYQGVEVWEGLRCHRVHVVTSSGGRPGVRTELWLAEDRNYIPARRVGYQYWISTELPTGGGRVVEWREVQPGIWFPAHTVDDAYFVGTLNQQAGHDPRTPRPNWHKDIWLESVTLNPNHDVSFFRFDFPPGTAVHELDGGEIKRSYRAGTPEEPQVRSESKVSRSPRWPRWPAAVAALLLGALILYLIARWWRGSGRHSLAHTHE